MNTLEVIRGNVKAIQFGMMSPEYIRSIAKVQITAKDYFESGKNDIKSGGLLDDRMGAVNRGSRCRTCRGLNLECPGHFGFIELSKPVFHIGYMQDIMDTLRCVCPHCGRVLLSKRDRLYKDKVFI